MSILNLQNPGNQQFNLIPPPLREYQTSAICDLRDSLRSGKRRPLLQCPTGGGKTRIAAEIVNMALEKGHQVIFTVPAISLIDQTASAFFRTGIYHVGVIQGNHEQTDPSAPVQIASIDTLKNRKVPDAGLVIVDEAHRLHKFYPEWMGKPEWQKVPFIGLSATPWTKGLGKIYDDLIIAETTEGLIDKGYLVPFHAFGPLSKIKPDLSKIGDVAGDYHQGQLSAEMQKPLLVADAVQTWLEKGEERPTLVFAVDRAHANKLNDQFTKCGVRSEYVDAYTKREERGAIGRRLEERETQVVVNIGTLTTGVDWPFVSCIVLCRPTHSEMLYTQIVGRGLRTHSSKSNCLILDHSDTTQRLGFVTDIHYDTLDDGKSNNNSAKKKKAEKQASLPKECDHCGYLKKAGVHKCPCCGWEPKRPSKIVHADGELVELTPKMAPKADKATKQMWYSMLIGLGRERGYKEGWAANQYREKFGCWPRDLKKIGTNANSEVCNFVRARKLAYARAQKAKAAAA